MATPLNILVLDDDRSVRELLRNVLEAEGYSCQVAADSQTAETILRRERCDLALIDIYLGTENGLEVLQRLKAIRPDCECVMMTAQATVETVTRSVAEGALEYLGKPILIPDLLALVRRIAGHRGQSQVTAEPEEQQPESAIIGKSPKILEVYRAIARVASTDATVLITGSSGTGKELVARAIHQHSQRASMPFTALNCAALPETMLEDELFGHEKGAFTGADSMRRGLFESSKGGTLFLDEIGETSLAFQVKMLRVLQEKQIRRLGSSTSILVDARILAATNADLPAMVREKNFREDLYYRLSVVQIAIPALKERREDIPLLARHFLNRFNQANRREVRMRKETMERLTQMEFPGNVRELENLIERAAIFSGTGEITIDDLEKQRAHPPPESAEIAPTRPSETLRDAEKQQILRVLREAGGNRSLAARRLGIERKTLYKKARRLGIDLDSMKT